MKINKQSLFHRNKLKLPKLNDAQWQLAALTILVIGLVIGVYLVQQQQEYRSRASQQIQSAFEVTDKEGKPLEIEGDAFKTQSLEVKIKVKELEVLSK